MILVTVQVIKIRCMRMTVHHRLMGMQMRMFPFHRRIMNMGMVFVIMTVTMLMNQRCVDMAVPVTAGRSKVGSGNHNSCGSSKGNGHRYLEDHKRQSHPNKRRNCIKCTCPGGTKCSLGKNIEIDRKTVRKESEQKCTAVCTKHPLMITISTGSFKESIRVQLFSKPQATQASRTKIDPTEKAKLLISSTVRMILAQTIRRIANQSLRSNASRKRRRAIIEVVTISKLFKREAFAAVVRGKTKHQQNRRGNIQHNHADDVQKILSAERCLANLLPADRLTTPIPIPAPRYSRAASSAEGTLSNSTFETGELIP